MSFKSSLRRHSIGGALLLLIPVSLFVTYVFLHAINVPFLDDDDLIYAINDVQNAPSDLLYILVRQQNDHRVAFPRLSMMVIYFITGKIDFRYTILFGLFNLALLSYTFYLIYRKYSYDLLGFSPIVLLLFSPLVYFGHLSAFPAYQHSLSIAFSILSLYYLQKNKRQVWYISLPFAFAATLTLLDGMSVIPIGLMWLLLQKRFRESIIFLGFSTLWMVAYFIEFKFSPATHLTVDITSLVQVLGGTVSFAGAAVRVFSDTYAGITTVAAGIPLLLAALALMIINLTNGTKPFSTKNIDLSRLALIDLCFLRVMASGIMIAVGRSAGDLSTMSAVRFQIYALSILILIYLMLLRWAGSQRRGRSVLVGMMVMGSTVLSGYSYIKYGSTVQELEKKLKADTYNYTHHHKFLHQYSNLVDPSPEFYRHYTFPEYFGQSMIARWHQTNEPSGAAITSHVILASDVTNDHIYNTMEFEVRNVPAHVEEESLYLTFENRIDSSEFYILGLNARRSWLLDAISEKVDRVFYATTLLKMPQGDYQARINWIENGEPKGIAVTADIHL